MFEKVSCIAPSTIANMGSGFDIVGFAIDGVYDQLTLHKIPSQDVEIDLACTHKIPQNPEENIVGICLKTMIKELKLNFGFHVCFEKKIRPGSGIGSSSASAVASVVGANALLKKPLSKEKLFRYALLGETKASGGAVHGDNVVPALFGGITAVLGYDPFYYQQIIPKKPYFCTVIHPDLVLKTSELRTILPEKIEMKKHIAQSTNLICLLLGFARSDDTLIAKGLQDNIIEAYRKPFIPQFDLLKKTAKENGALGSSIAGSGPSYFAISNTEIIAKKVADSFEEFMRKIGIPYQVYVSRIREKGAEIILK